MKKYIILALCSLFLVPAFAQDSVKVAKKAAVKKLIRVSSPGLRTYTDVENMPRVLNGLGIAILSTSKGIITDKEAKTLNVGGEVLCYVY